MEITNFNIFYICIFLFFWFWMIYLFKRNYKKQKDFNNKYKLLSTNKYFFIKNLFLLFSFLVILISIFWIKYWEKKSVNENLWIDIIFVLDVSKSMNVADIKDSDYYYTRLDAAKKAISEFVSKNKENRYWLVIFSWDAVSSVPLTNDLDIFQTFLVWVDYKNLTKQWSNFKKALELWIQRFTNISNDRSKALVFISDGWDNEDKINSDVIKNIIKNQKGINYYVLWVWSKKWWKIITWKDIFWRINYQTFNWDYVISKLNEDNLIEIKNWLSWKYFKISQINDLTDSLNKLQKNVIKTDVNWEKENIWRYLAFVSFLFFIIFIILYLLEDKIYLLINKLWIKK